MGKDHPPPPLLIADHMNQVRDILRSKSLLLYIATIHYYIITLLLIITTAGLRSWGGGMCTVLH